MTLPIAKRRSALLLAVTLVSLWGCIAPVPAPTRTSAPPSLKNKIDTQFIQPGQTTREEVEDRLGWGSVDLGEKRLFWGRWTTSSSAVFWAVGGAGGASAGGGRHWSAKNVLIEFDDASKVRSSHVVADQEIVKQIGSMLKVDSSQFGSPRTLKLDHVHQGAKDPVTVVLARDAITYTDLEARKGKGLTFQVSPEKLVSIGISRYRKPDAEDPDEIWFTLHFSEKTAAGKNILFVGTPEDLGVLIRLHVEAAQARATSK